MYIYYAANSLQSHKHRRALARKRIMNEMMALSSEWLRRPAGRPPSRASLLTFAVFARDQAAGRAAAPLAGGKLKVIYLFARSFVLTHGGRLAFGPNFRRQKSASSRAWHCEHAIARSEQQQQQPQPQHQRRQLQYSSIHSFFALSSFARAPQRKHHFNLRPLVCAPSARTNAARSQVGDSAAAPA